METILEAKRAAEAAWNLYNAFTETHQHLTGAYLLSRGDKHGYHLTKKANGRVKLGLGLPNAVEA